MIGDITYMDDRSYIQINDEGTLVKLPQVRWYRTLQIFWLNHWYNLSINYVRSFYYDHAIGVK